MLRVYGPCHELYRRGGFPGEQATGVAWQKPESNYETRGRINGNSNNVGNEVIQFQDMTHFAVSN
jgi:hypothetical protein